MIFLTVGTQFPFERLIKAVDHILEQNPNKEEVFAQIGNSLYKPRNFAHVSSMTSKHFENYFKKASAVIGHAGVGTITMALNLNKPLLVMPRMQVYHEHVNDHQVALVRKFEQQGYILAAYSEQQLSHQMESLKAFVPSKRSIQPRPVIKRIERFLKEIELKKTD